jgi:hypothetical protein
MVEYGMPEEYQHDASALTRMRNMLPCLEHMDKMGHRALVPINVQRLAVFGLFKSIKDHSLRAQIIVDATNALGAPIGGQALKAEMDEISDTVKKLAPTHFVSYKALHIKAIVDDPERSDDIVGLMAQSHNLARDQYEMKLTIIGKLQKQIDVLVTSTDLKTLESLDGPELSRLL